MVPYLATINLFITILLSKSMVSYGSLNFAGQCLNDFYSHEPYIDNLYTALNKLPSHAATSSFYNTTAGQAYALYLCRGDSTLTLCSSCVTALTGSISMSSSLVSQGCSDGFAYSAQNCLIRFANYSFIGTYEPRGEFASIDGSETNATDFAEYNRTLAAVVPGLIAETAFNSTALFATKEGGVEGGGKVYALAQCTPDISRRNCSACLSDAFGAIEARSGRTSYAWAMLPSCQLRYDNVSFYSKAAAAAVNPPSVSVALFLAALGLVFVQLFFS